MDLLIIGITAFSASILTFFSGFGLGTLLMPVFALFFEIEIAIALTGIVHLMNNLFKTVLVGKNINWDVVLKFGLTGFIGSLIGAFTLLAFSKSNYEISYTIANQIFTVSPINLFISILIFSFAFLELFPFYKKLSFKKNKIYFGGLLSGFFGGFSGHQGALRSAFLIKLNLSKISFIASGIMIATIVDMSRLSIYFTQYKELHINENLSALITAILCAFTGAYFGRKILNKITVSFIQYSVILMLMLLSIVMALGII